MKSWHIVAYRGISWHIGHRRKVVADREESFRIVGDRKIVGYRKIVRYRNIHIYQTIQRYRDRSWEIVSHRDIS